MGLGAQGGIWGASAAAALATASSTADKPLALRFQGVVHGLVNIVSLERRVVEDVRVCLAGQQRLVHPMGAIEAFEAYRQTLSLAAVSGSTRIELERGVNRSVLPRSHVRVRAFSGS